MLHITDGESVAGTLRESAVPGEVSIYGDLMYEGPAPGGLSSEAWREARARFLSEPGDPCLEEACRYLEAFEDVLEAISKHDETILWLDHRLSDQLILIKVLDWLSHRHLGRTTLSLICIDRHPDTDQFVSLAQLSPAQLPPLAPTPLPF